MHSAVRVQLLVEWRREEGVPAVYGNFPMARPWAGSGILIFFFNSSSIIGHTLTLVLSGRGNYTRTMDKKTIIIATIKSQVALYDQLLFSPRAFCVLLLRLFSVPTKCKACLHDHLLLHGQLFGSSLAYSSINIIITMINPILISHYNINEPPLTDFKQT